MIFGAGASRNYSQATHGVKGLQMPLDSDFFVMAKKAIFSNLKQNMFYPMSLDLEHLADELFHLFANTESGSIKNKVTKNWPKDTLSIFDNKQLSLEYVMSLFYEYQVFEDSHYSIFGGIGKNRINALFELTAYTLMLAQKGPTCEKHLKIAKNVKKDDIIISFNYDTILDNALRQAKKLTDIGYVLDFNKVFSKNKWELPEQKESQATLMKLHGSLNWIRCKRCKLNFLMKKKVQINTRMDIWKYLHPDCIRCGETTTEIVIIPPLIGKNYHEFGLDYLWSDASKIINDKKKNINEIIIFGYSLPKADITSTLLFRKASYSLRNNKNIKLKIINPDKKIVQHFSKIFKHSKIFHYDSMQKFLNSLN